MTQTVNLDNIYTPQIPPVADSDELAAKGTRLMLKYCKGFVEIEEAPKGIMWSGWVIGIEINTDTQTEHSPLPWKRWTTEFASSIGPDGNHPVAKILSGNIADAQFIVQACNSHYELIEFVRAYADGELCDRTAAKALLARAAIQKAQSV